MKAAEQRYSMAVARRTEESLAFRQHSIHAEVQRLEREASLALMALNKQETST
jgi:hypothetical protein